MDLDRDNAAYERLFREAERAACTIPRVITLQPVLCRSHNSERNRSDYSVTRALLHTGTRREQPVTSTMPVVAALTTVDNDLPRVSLLSRQTLYTFLTSRNKPEDRPPVI